jgi:uncharacterized membrane protein HdeD (DUF308 family)
MRGMYFVVLISCLLLLRVRVTRAIFQFNDTPLRRWKAGFKASTSGLSEIDWNPFDDDGVDEEKDLVEQILPGLSSLATTIYGITLLFSGAGANADSQIHLMTMMRTTGFHKIEAGFKEAKKNFRQAYRSAIWHAPSFALAAQSVQHMQDRVRGARSILEETRAAKADGIITPCEAKKLRRVKKKEIRDLQRDMKRLTRASANLGTVFRLLDIDEIMDLIKGFLFQIVAVLASDDSDSRVATIIRQWCLFLNLGDLILENDKKLGYPIIRLILTKKFRSTETLDKHKEQAVVMAGKAIWYGIAGCLVLFNVNLAWKLNASFLISAFILRGIRSLVATFRDKDDVEMDVWSKLGILLNGTGGGALMICLVWAGLLVRDWAETGQFNPPIWLTSPVIAVENGIVMLVVIIGKIL